MLRAGIAIVLIALPWMQAALPPLHLDAPADRDAFRRWFTLLGESRFFAGAPIPEVADCAGLVRWAAREALAAHTSEWAGRVGLAALPAMPPVRQFAWPATPWGASLFRTGAARVGQFADAATLRRLNSAFVSRDLAAARPGDLLFYKQFDRRMPAHVMIYLGRSQFTPGAERWIVYHTGPSGRRPGEVRRVTVRELEAHPSPEWRPLAGNGNFLGVWRLGLVTEQS